MTVLLSEYDNTTQELAFRIYAERIPETERRQQHRTEHLAALDLISAALAQDFGVYHAVIRRTGLGKPKLIHDFLHINISHCKGLAVAAVGRMPIGVDAEAPRAVRETMVRKICTAAEAAYIDTAEDKNLAFSRIWTLKEAYAKYTGEGIALKFSQLGFSFAADGAVQFHHPAADSVRLYHMLYDGFAISVCCEKDR